MRMKDPLLLVASFVGTLIAVVASEAHAQQPSTPLRPTAALQGVDKELPEDFFAELQESKLKLQVAPLAEDRSTADLDSALVTLISPNGRIGSQRPDAKGAVVFDGVPEGPVGVVVTGPDLHATAAVYTREVAEDDAGAPDPTAIAKPFRLPVMRISNSEVLKNTSGYEVNPATRRDFAGADYERFSEYQAQQVVYYRTRINADGTLPGRVFTLVDPELEIDYSGTNIAIYENGEYIRGTTTSPKGYFDVPGMKPGVYGVVASGPLGYSAFAFEAVGNAAPLPVPSVAKKDSPFRTAGFLQPAGPGESKMLYSPMLPPAMLPYLRSTVVGQYGSAGGSADAVATGPVAPVNGTGLGAGGGMAGGSAGGSGGGGGGVGGGGGTGGLLGLAGLGAALAIATDDDDDNFIPPGPTSPAIPLDDEL